MRWGWALAWGIDIFLYEQNMRVDAYIDVGACSGNNGIYNIHTYILYVYNYTYTYYYKIYDIAICLYTFRNVTSMLLDLYKYDIIQSMARHITLIKSKI